MDTEDEPYQKPSFTAEVNIDSTGEFAWRPHRGSCLTKKAALEAIQALNQMPADRRAVWVKRLDLSESVKVCPILKGDKEVAEALDELVSAYKGST